MPLYGKATGLGQVLAFSVLTNLNLDISQSQQNLFMQNLTWFSPHRGGASGIFLPDLKDDKEKSNKHISMRWFSYL